MRDDRDRGACRGGPWRRRRWTLRNGRADDRGSATVEFAVTLPGVVVLLLIFVAGWSAFAAKVRLTDAAGLAARAAARGEPVASRGAMPAGATISVQRDGDLVRVTVRQRVGLGPLPSITLQEEAAALIEPGAESS
ncbi:hypothetical protein GCM10009827_082810 [Dactylosporangium maewongense]|uniref:Pilus assembly protein n=1 Tax=Dactylosporangium maewongense TaxID=634393 RepID=A0ABN2BZR9_9ACTN